jgi:hypothetical protein
MELSKLVSDGSTLIRMMEPIYQELFSTFSQVPGKDVTDRLAPFMTGLAFRLALNIKVVKQLRTAQFDIESAFLYSDYDEKIYMRLPDCYPKFLLEVHNDVISSSTQVLVFKILIYVLVQDARKC